MSETTAIITQPQRAAQLARQKIYAGIPNDDVDLALAICQKYGLDPLLKHVVLIEGSRKDKDGNWVKQYSIYVTRDGLLHTAHTSGIPFAVEFDPPELRPNPYAGKDDIYLTGTLKRQGYPDFKAGLWFSEYCSTNRNEQPIGAWKTHPAAMHQKAVEVYLLRRGFDVSLPAYDEVQPTGAMVEPEERRQLEAETPKSDNGDTPHWIKDPKVRARFWAWTGGTLGLNNDQVHEALGVDHVEEYDGTMEEAKAQIEAWIVTNAKPDAKQATDELFGEPVPA